MSDDQHPVGALDDVVHQRHRLGILTVLAEGGRADFAYLKATLSLTDGNLGRHLRVLEDAGYVAIDKTFEGRRPRTWAQITPAGRRALTAELGALRDLIERIDGGRR